MSNGFHLPIGGAVDLRKKAEMELVQKAQIDAMILNLSTNLFISHFRYVIEEKVNIEQLHVLCTQAARYHAEQNVKEQERLEKEYAKSTRSR